MTDAVWQAVHAERRALVEDLEQLSRADWDAPSLCDGWSVHDVVIHLVASARESRRRFAVQLARARFDFHRLNRRQIEAGRRLDPAQTLEAFRSLIDATATPPAARITRLIEVVVHGEDVRRPLQIRRDVPTKLLGAAIDHVAGDRLDGGRDRLRGLALRASDAPITIGSGPGVDGAACSLLLAAARGVGTAERARRPPRSRGEHPRGSARRMITQRRVNAAHVHRARTRKPLGEQRRCWFRVAPRPHGAGRAVRPADQHRSLQEAP